MTNFNSFLPVLFLLLMTLIASTSAKHPTSKCYTHTTTVSPVSCPPTHCPPVPQCILLGTTTLTLPPSNSLCPLTSTKTKTASCSCQTGCRTITSTITDIQGQPSSSSSSSNTTLTYPTNIPTNSSGPVLLTPTSVVSPVTSLTGYTPPTTFYTSTSTPTSKCYTHTTTVPNLTCPPFNTSSAGGCIVPLCVIESMTTVPGPRAACPTTRTVEVYGTCQTACPSGCGTFVLTVTAG